MYRTPRAVLVALAAITVPTVASAATADNSTTGVPPAQQCKPAKVVYAEKNWRQADPAKGERVCPSASKRGAAATRRHFREYREYRKITPYRCQSGSEGTYAIPCGIIECESHFNWWAQNPSGAKWIYQLLGWGAPAPSSFHNRLLNHQIAAGLSLSNWACA